MSIASRDRFQKLIDWMGKLIQLFLYGVGVVVAVFILYLAIKGGIWAVRFIEGLGQ